MQRTEPLSRLFDAVPDAFRELAVTGIETDTRRLQPGMLYVGLHNHRGDADQFLAEAWKAGAVAAVLEAGHEAVIPQVNGPACWQTPELRDKLGQALRRWHRWDEGAAPLLIGVTGTNGKSSVTRLIAELAPQPAMIIGTLGYGPVDALVPHANTTPEAVRLWETLASLRDRGAKVIALEVSSHALALGRVAAVPFAAAVFTNLSRDHLDFHGDMDQYGAAKARLFKFPDLKLAVLNRDDPFSAQIAQQIDPSVNVLGFGAGAWDFQVREIHAGASGTLLTLGTPEGLRQLRSPLLGQSNVENLLAALAVAHGMGWKVSDADVHHLDLPEGRYQRLPAISGKAQVMIDYAHTPDALERILKDIRAVAKGQVHVLFGCGGDRDRGKRPEMGKVAELLADRVTLTDDNPRSENADDIIRDILAGMQHPEAIEVIHDRAAAIHQAIHQAQSGDWVLIAGKGHERTQEIMGQKTPFHDQQVAMEALRP
ncbi:UDP-N-acetylmuramoyl-L-alanyl-D-glutamate--2,6-diaminopimelate ligase [Acidithiobacillus sp.]|jgi:UDP-N-acetylmuramoyl-L-alanyl-D-glutamate--2,6-diaminopimelate ligase|uniref:UDP-N-acetylmuramoyl-L-alanyl-D-glutamate--2, 6-diaminopimelate ligase n=1 Tax=Acidithiobacillus sp. TaxID=1872118 RepID=UPI00360593D8